MATFRYRALDAGGRTKKGYVDADGSGHAGRLLRDKGLYPLELSPVRESRAGRAKTSAKGQPKGAAKSSAESSGGSAPAKRFSLKLPKPGSRISKSQVAATVRQLATLLGAGIPLDGALSTMVGRGARTPMQRVLADIRDRIREGGDLAAAFADYPRVFSDTFVTMVRAGEASGTLDIVMERLAEHIEQQVALTRKVQGALAYPLLMLVVGVGVVVFMLTFVIPKVTEIFIDMDRALPLPTQILMTVSDGLRDNWLFILLGLGLLLLGFSRYTRTPAGRRRLHRFLLHAPVIGSLFRAIAVGRMCRTLGMLLKNGVTLVKALGIVRTVAGNVVLEKAVGDMFEGVQEGHTLAEHMAASPVFPETAVQMVAAGEGSGQLARMLLVVAQDCENQVETRLQVVTSLMEPLMILFLGGAVGFVVMAIILPIFEMSNLVG